MVKFAVDGDLLFGYIFQIFASSNFLGDHLDSITLPLGNIFLVNSRKRSPSQYIFLYSDRLIQPDLVLVSFG